MSCYEFATPELGISKEGFHLLRSGYNYKTLRFAEARSIRIGTGKQISNRVLALVFGIGLIFAGLYVLFYACYAFYLGKAKVYVEQFAFAAIPVFIGSYALFMALKKGAIIELTTGTTKTTFPIDELRKSGELDALTRFLKTNPLSAGKFNQDSKSHS